MRVAPAITLLVVLGCDREGGGVAPTTARASPPSTERTPSTTATPTPGSVSYGVNTETGAAYGGQSLGLDVIGVAFGSDEDDAFVHGLSADGALIRLANSATTVGLPVSGVAPGSSLVAIDDGHRGVVAVSDAGVLYDVEPTSSRGTPLVDVGAPLGTGVGLDGGADGWRVVTADGANVHVDLGSGTVTVDGQPAFAADDVHAGIVPRLVALASDGPLLVAVDAATGSLVRFEDPATGIVRTIGPLGITVTDGTSLDLFPNGEGALVVPG